jgi:hypothetical protein
VVYYWHTADHEIWMLVAYPKGAKEDLSHDEIKELKRLVEAFEL